MAVIELLPTASPMVEYVATPAPFTATVASTVVPIWKLTVPEFGAPDGDETTAVSVILLLCAALVADACNTVVLVTVTPCKKIGFEALP